LVDEIFLLGPFTGNTAGSCFPPDFGGSCGGIPTGCQECIGLCRGKLGQRFSRPAF